MKIEAKHTLKALIFINTNGTEWQIAMSAAVI